MNEHLSIDSGGYLCMNSLCVLIAASLSFSENQVFDYTYIEHVLSLWYMSTQLCITCLHYVVVKESSYDCLRHITLKVTEHLSLIV